MRRIAFNSPLILIFTFAAVAVMAVDTATPGSFTGAYIALQSKEGGGLGYLNYLTYIIGHADWQHLIGNFTFILLLGPALEEKFGWKNLLLMIVITTLSTGFLTILLGNGLVGASGIVFMMILLSSFTNSAAGKIPLTFLLVAPLFLTGEFFNGLRDDNISQLAHIAGGAMGAAFGYLSLRRKRGK